jgi:nucleotide-binding universal stress UspA family protein
MASTQLGKMVVAYDGSDNSARAVRMASDLAKKYGSQVLVVHVYSSPSLPYSPAGVPIPSYSELEEAAERSAKSVLAKGVALANEAGVDARGELLEASSTVQALVELSNAEKADLLVVGTRGMTGFRKLVLGSVSSGIVSHAVCSVLVVR